MGLHPLWRFAPRVELRFYVSVKSKLQHPPPPRHTPAFDIFPVPGKREFDYQSLPGGGEFDPHRLGVGNLNCTLDFMWNLWRGELYIMGDAVLEDFRGKDCAFVKPIGYEEWAEQALCRIWRYLHFKIFNIGYNFRLWIHECCKLYLQWNTIPIPAIQYNN